VVGLRSFVREAYPNELIHLLLAVLSALGVVVIGCSGLFIPQYAWTDRWVGICFTLVFSLMLNAPFVILQRYTRIRALRLIVKKQRLGEEG
jgi:hypothetical protein